MLLNTPHYVADICKVERV